ncbi:fatty acid desaturase family protein [Pseudodonghicola flavimaris]|uniref:Fatty acid desaturase n=1 Tax=Pseudodonghicola flavimaris TaxID=3050036 RepID=A0ABT7EY72_9RHOB|nr:fatty acid desaturase [Pseudodonghicola flavimaris]MDK3017290.1 fatty acid desaturase [Pseudodonghicola flavimaris]
MIDRKFFVPRPARYYRDFLTYLAVFAVSFVWGIGADGPWVLLPWVLAVLSLHRAGLFCHEVVHSKHASLRLFRALYTWTVAVIVMVPPIRFGLPHLAHHRLGVFGTPEDPQYPLVRGNPFAMVMVLVVIPFIVPFTNLLMTITGALGAFRFERALDRWATENFGFSLSSELTAEQQGEVRRHAQVTLVVFVLFVALLPSALPFYYAVMVGGWALITARIPLEHELEALAEASGPRDQMVDSFTIESPLALLIQPIGFRFHTAHHMYPGVPYHNLPALHEELKRSSPDYRNSIISIRTAIRGPKPVRGS